VSAQQKSITINGQRLSYLEDGEGPAAIFLHGMGGAPPAGANFIASLATVRRVLLPSLPGWDDSELGACATHQDLAEVIAGLIQWCADGPVDLVGESAGSPVALWLTIHHPELVNKLVLVAPPVLGQPHRPSFRSTDELLRMLYGDSPDWTEPPSAVDEERRVRNSSANAQRYRSPEAAQELLAKLPEVNVPTLLLWGTEDQISPPELGAPYKQLIPNAYRIYLHGAAHSLPIAAGPRFVTLTLDFLDRGEFFVVNPGRE
jgi:4,5:9,10-diseco-3-hydroxy-5,9,17-trioxoandrosta-1(10),2-diene-4-oate hydrolase